MRACAKDAIQVKYAARTARAHAPLFGGRRHTRSRERNETLSLGEAGATGARRFLSKGFSLSLSLSLGRPSARRYAGSCRARALSNSEGATKKPMRRLSPGHAPLSPRRARGLGDCVFFLSSFCLALQAAAVPKFTEVKYADTVEARIRGVRLFCPCGEKRNPRRRKRRRLPSARLAHADLAHQEQDALSACVWLGRRARSGATTHPVAVRLPTRTGAGEL